MTKSKPPVPCKIRGTVRPARDAELLDALKVLQRMQVGQPPNWGVSITELARRCTKGRFAMRDWLYRCVQNGTVPMFHNEKNAQRYRLVDGWEEILKAAIEERDEKMRQCGRELQAAHPVVHEPPPEAHRINTALLAAAQEFAQQRWPGVRTTWAGGRPALLEMH